MHSFITHLLCVLDNIKSYHWSCKSYARHKASDELHGTLSKLVDSFVEIYLGEHEKRPTFGDDDHIELKNWSDDEIIEMLKEFATWLANDLSGVAGNSLSLNHIIEEMSSAVHQALYLFTFA
jgi:hypothetical protein